MKEHIDSLNKSKKLIEFKLKEDPLSKQTLKSFIVAGSKNPYNVPSEKEVLEILLSDLKAIEKKEDVLEDISRVLKFIFGKLDYSKMFVDEKEKNQFEALRYYFEDKSEGSLRSTYKKSISAQFQYFRSVLSQ